MTVASEEIVDSASISAASTKRRSLWLVALRNPNVIVGGFILLVMLAIAILAPFATPASAVPEPAGERS